MDRVRRVVTGTVAGRSAVVADEALEAFAPALLPGMGFVHLWGADQTVTLPSDGSEPPIAAYFPQTTGFRVALVTIPPERGVDGATLDGAALSAAAAEVENRLPGLLAHMEPDAPGMHTSDTVDIDIVLSGEIVLELDDGAEVALRAGDCVVQNGTRHAWHNRTSQPCTLSVTLVGAGRARQDV